MKIKKIIIFKTLHKRTSWIRLCFGHSPKMSKNVTNFQKKMLLEHLKKFKTGSWNNNLKQSKEKNFGNVDDTSRAIMSTCIVNNLCHRNTTLRNVQVNKKKIGIIEINGLCEL